MLFLLKVKKEKTGLLFPLPSHIPPEQLSAGLFGRHHCGSNISIEHLEVLDCICAIFKLHTHASIDNGRGILLPLGLTQPCHKVPLERQNHSECLGLSITPPHSKNLGDV